ncbi:PRC-barrel domain-containing protein [Ancylobacter lacus]|uniref:PRC-barrel domain-containing protein n=1 Tax=Ancylobacter lacus TaxID=2579970 RepID=UPI001BD18CA7|nr:PRC-barrel domain-containing protein [Ancylobacter lacus]MBS7541039.1 PRC-barrel domain-containing protein [Ancylobacter lacus]
MTNKFVTLTALAALSLTPAVALAQSAAPTTPPAATETAPSTAPVNPSTTAPAENMPSQATVSPTGARFINEQAAGQWMSSDLVGTNVVTATDESLGSISDLIVEKDGRVTAAVIDVGGFLGIGAKPVAVSFNALTVAPADNGQKVVVSASRDELNQAPEFKTLEQSRSASSTPATTQPGAQPTQ